MTKSTLAGYDPERLHAVRVREDTLFRTRIPHSLDLAARARRRMPDGVPMAWIDDTLVEREGATSVAFLLGTSAQVAKQTRVVPFNHLEALGEALAPRDVAAVITEPALTNIGVIQPSQIFTPRYAPLHDRQARS